MSFAAGSMRGKPFVDVLRAYYPMADRETIEQMLVWALPSKPKEVIEVEAPRANAA